MVIYMSYESLLFPKLACKWKIKQKQSVNALNMSNKETKVTRMMYVFVFYVYLKVYCAILLMVTDGHLQQPNFQYHRGFPRLLCDLKPKTVLV